VVPTRTFSMRPFRQRSRPRPWGRRSPHHHRSMAAKCGRASRSRTGEPGCAATWSTCRSGSSWWHRSASWIARSRTISSAVEARPGTCVGTTSEARSSRARASRCRTSRLVPEQRETRRGHPTGYGSLPVTVAHRDNRTSAPDRPRPKQSRGGQARASCLILSGVCPRIGDWTRSIAADPADATDPTHPSTLTKGADEPHHDRQHVAQSLAGSPDRPGQESRVHPQPVRRRRVARGRTPPLRPGRRTDRRLRERHRGHQAKPGRRGVELRLAARRRRTPSRPAAPAAR